jgi:hypothetical protein
MRLFHRSDLGRTRLLAAGALEGPDRQRAEAHLETCGDCAREFSGVKALLSLVAQDPLRRAEPTISLAALRARVDARLASPRGEGRGAGGWAFGLRPTLAAAAAVILCVWNLPTRPGGPREAAPNLPPPSEESLDRLERTLVREETVRYLNAAQEVLVTVASPNRCLRKAGHVEVSEESRRSRALLERRSLLVGNETSAAPSAQPVLDDVERVLREVASLDPCASRSKLEEIHREVSQRHLLLRIDLMTRELEG